MYFKFDDGEAKKFETASVLSKPLFEAMNISTLRGKTIQRITRRGRKWEIIINPLSINNENALKFLQDFFLADKREISEDGSAFREVIADPGEFPVEFYEGAKFLQVIKFSLISKDSNANMLSGETGL